MSLLDKIREVIRIEREGLETLEQKLNEQAVQAVELLVACRGRAILTGMGKTGLIGRKIAATLSSTGTPAFYLNPAEAIHGDLGIVTEEDILIALSNSGETEEIVRLLPSFRRLHVKVIAMTGNPNSTLARHSEVVLDVGVEKEADPSGIAPTASTTAALVMGDALAMALVVKRGFTKEQFAIFHPGGHLGRRLLLHVKDLMHVGDCLPLVSPETSLRDAIYVMTTAGLGTTFVVKDEDCLVGIFTDGDVRRLLQRESNPLEKPMGDVMTEKPKVIAEDALAAEALKLMEDNSITVLPVVTDKGQVRGALHLHDLVRAGLA